MHLRLWLAFAAISMTTTGCPSDPPITEETGGDEETETAGEESEGGSEPDPTAGPEPLVDVPLEEFFAKAEEAYCAWQVNCHGFGGAGRCASVTHFDVRMSIGAIAGVGSYDLFTPAYIIEAVEIGRIEYDSVAAATCLNFAAARTCEYGGLHEWTEEELAGQAACLGVFQGRMGKNGPCSTALECAEEAICGFNPNCTDMCCAGACRVLAPPIPLGEPCGMTNASCEAESYCGVDLVCVELPKIGESCEQSFDCAGDGSCTYTDNDTLECVAPAAEGESCDNIQCERGLACLYDQDFFAATCVRPADEGEPCMVSFDSGGTCKRFDNYCDPVTATCKVLPGNGESCDYVSCRGDFFCAYSVGQKCSPVADEGEGCDYNGSDYVPCSGDNQCSYDGNTSVCVVPTGEQCPPPSDPQGG